MKPPAASGSPAAAAAAAAGVATVSVPCTPAPAAVAPDANLGRVVTLGCPDRGAGCAGGTVGKDPHAEEGVGVGAGVKGVGYAL
eukprot:scaffold115795_cov23-Tisochrysis_lutea.AAC.1